MIPKSGHRFSEKIMLQQQIRTRWRFEEKSSRSEPEIQMERQMNWGNLLFSYEGRINRAKFWLAVLVYFVASIVAAIVGLGISDAVGQLLINGVSLVAFVSGIFVAIKRLHDRDRSGWWLLLFYIAPSVLLAIGIIWAVAAIVAGSSGGIGWLIILAGFAVGIWGFVELGCLRGTIGPNQYGPDPLMLPAPGSTAVPPPAPPPSTMAPPPPPLPPRAP
jgi:uncharacterized membrane protein YhaH (DUF805 family)